jgi:hypothetical protein
MFLITGYPPSHCPQSFSSQDDSAWMPTLGPHCAQRIVIAQSWLGTEGVARQPARDARVPMGEGFS